MRRLALLLLLAAACGGNGGSSPTGVGLTTVASGLAQPLALAFLPDGTMLVGEKRGEVVALRDGRAAAAPVLDIRGRVSTGSEQGLLGLAVVPGSRGRQPVVD